MKIQSIIMTLGFLLATSAYTMVGGPYCNRSDDDSERNQVFARSASNLEEAEQKVLDQAENQAISRLKRHENNEALRCTHFEISEPVCHSIEQDKGFKGLMARLEGALKISFEGSLAKFTTKTNSHKKKNGCVLFKTSRRLRINPKAAIPKVKIDFKGKKEEKYKCSVLIHYWKEEPKLQPTPEPTPNVEYRTITEVKKNPQYSAVIRAYQNNASKKPCSEYGFMGDKYKGKYCVKDPQKGGIFVYEMGGAVEATVEMEKVTQIIKQKRTISPDNEVSAWETISNDITTTKVK